jgi:integrating conjugative element protein (TIGR03755 family)
MKLLAKLFLFLFLIISFQAKAYTPPIMPSDTEEEIYYEIGGGTNFRVVGGIETPKELMMIRDFSLLLGDGDFNPLDSIKKTLEGIVQGFIDQWTNKVKGMLNLDQWTAQLSQLPGNMFCQANPTACQLQENYTIRAEKKEKAQRKFLQDMERELGNTRGKLEGWLNAAKSNYMIKVMNDAKNSGEEDIEKVTGKIRDFTGEVGLKWIGGVMAGGNDQPPIRPIADTAKAGFNMLLGRAVTEGGSASGDDPLLDYWDTPEEAAKWITEVVGESRPDINNVHAQDAITATKKGSDDGDLGLGGEDVIVTNAFLSTDMSTPAMGLSPKIKKESLAYQQKIIALVDSNTPPTTDELTQMMGKSGNTIITPKIINIIKNSPLDTVLIKQLSDDISMVNNIRYALEARRILLAGRNETHIAAYKVATDEIDTRAARLKEYIENTMFDRDVSRQLLSDSLGKIYSYTRERTNDGINTTPTRTRPTIGNGGRILNNE